MENPSERIKNLHMPEDDIKQLKDELINQLGEGVEIFWEGIRQTISQAQGNVYLSTFSSAHLDTLLTQKRDEAAASQSQRSRSPGSSPG